MKTAEELFAKYKRFTDKKYTGYSLRKNDFTLALTEYRESIEPVIRMDQDVINHKAVLNYQDEIIEIAQREYKSDIIKLVDEMIKECEGNYDNAVYCCGKEYTETHHTIMRSKIIALTELKQKIEEPK